MKRLTLLALILAAFALGTSPASAWNGPYCGPGFGWGYGYLYQNLDFKIPYFAAFPPVYYSHPVARPYGYSPFAYPPGTETPHVVVEPPCPATIINPHVETPATEPVEEGGTSSESVTSVPQPKPLVVLNPFVEQRFARASK
jgi:hypothetical protein